jgi:hypothetical protein
VEPVMLIRMGISLDDRSTSHRRASPAPAKVRGFFTRRLARIGVKNVAGVVSMVGAEQHPDDKPQVKAPTRQQARGISAYRAIRYMDR